MKNKKIIIILIIAILGLSLVLYSIDKSRVDDLKDPIFAIRHIKKGDTTKYTCLFYSVEKIEFEEIFPLEWDPNENYESYQNEDQYTIYFWFEKWFE